jgi:anti-anti-sigma factor
MNDPSQHLDLTVVQGPDEVVLTVAGELDYFTSASFGDRVTEVIDLLRPVTVLDLAGVEFCDSAGLAALIHAGQRANRVQTRLVLRAVHPAVHRVLGIAGLTSMFTLEPAEGGSGPDTSADELSPR